MRGPRQRESLHEGLLRLAAEHFGAAAVGDGGGRSDMVGVSMGQDNRGDAIGLRQGFCRRQDRELPAGEARIDQREAPVVPHQEHGHLKAPVQVDRGHMAADRTQACDGHGCL